MTRIVLGEAPGQWVLAEMNSRAAFDINMTAIGFKRDGKMIAGFLFENWNGQSLMAHMAIQGRASREFYRFAAEYVFKQCGAYKLIASIVSDNHRSMNLATKMGFRYEARIANAAPHGDICIFTLVESDCRFLKGAYIGQAQPASFA